MADKYCKKSSLEAIADEIRVRNGDSSSTKYLFPNEFESTISGLLIPTQRGAPSKELKTNDSSYTIQRGVYTGGSVFVDPISYEGQNAINPTFSQQTIKDSTNNKPIKKVVVNGFDSHPLAAGGWRGSVKSPTSITISGLSFTPVGAIFLLATSNTEKLAINMLWKIGNTIGGHATPNNSTSNSNRSALITSANFTFSNGSLSVSNIQCTDTSGTNTAHFYQTSTSASSNQLYVYYIWG